MYNAYVFKNYSLCNWKLIYSVVAANLPGVSGLQGEAEAESGH